MAGPTEHEFAGDPQSPAAARGFAKSAMNALLPPPLPVELCDDVELVVSELVTNAVRAGSDSVLVSLAVEDGRVVIRVSDEAAGWPEQRTAGNHDTGGRGLPLVSAVSVSWGVRLAGARKVVWAELAIPA